MFSWIQTIAGVVLLALGAAVSVMGGVLRDARSELAVGKELRQAVQGDAHLGVAAGEMIESPGARSDAAQTNQQVRALLNRRVERDRALARPAGAFLLLIMIGTYILSGSMVSLTPVGHADALRDMGLAVVIGAAGWRLLTTPGRHPFAGSAAVVAGLFLALQGLLAPHGNAALGPVEVILGVMAMTAAVTAVLSPEPDDTGHPHRDGQPILPGLDVARLPVVPARINNLGPTVEKTSLRVPRSLILFFVVALGLVRAVRGVREPMGLSELKQLRYHVPLGQDAAAVLGAVRLADFEAKVHVAGGYEDIVVMCHPDTDRERLRRVLSDAPVDMAGNPFDTPPVTFAGE